MTENDNSDFNVALAVARDILLWPANDLKRIKSSTMAEKKAFIHWMKQICEIEIGNKRKVAME